MSGIFGIPESGTFLLEESRIWENFGRGIRNPGLWNPEYSSTESGIPPTIRIRNLPKARIQFLETESTAWDPESKTVLDSLTWDKKGSQLPLAWISAVSSSGKTSVRDVFSLGCLRRQETAELQAKRAAKSWLTCLSTKIDNKLSQDEEFILLSNFIVQGSLFFKATNHYFVVRIIKYESRKRFLHGETGWKNNLYWANEEWWNCFLWEKTNFYPFNSRRGEIKCPQSRGNV